MEYKTEENRFVRAFIWLWYNDWVRLFLMSGIYLIPLGLFLSRFIPEEFIRFIIAGVYLVIMALLFVFNDYSNLRRIGLDEYRRFLSKK